MSVQADHSALTSRPSRTYYEGQVRIPGYRNQPTRCQPYYPVGFCEAEGHVMLGQSDCETRSCPEHWSGWSRKATVNAVERLAKYRASQPDGNDRRLLHVVASPDDQNSRWTSERLWQERADAQEAVKAAGIEGGVCIPHPYRAAETAKQAFRDACNDPESYWQKADGIWRYLRDTSPEWSDLQEKIEAGPHFHFFAVGSVEADQIPNGYVVKNVRSLDPFYVDGSEVPPWQIHQADKSREGIAKDGYGDMIAGVRYVLSHAAEQPDRQTVSYFGDVSVATFRPEQELESSVTSTIEKMVASVVGYGDEDDDDKIEGRECPRDGCESGIIPAERLAEFLEDKQWLVTIASEQRDRLRGAYHLLETADRPPPSIASDKDALLEWLGKRRDQRPTPEPIGHVPPEPVQVGLPT